MKFYIATNFANWKAAKSLRGFLERRGFVVTSRWIEIAADRAGVGEPLGDDDGKMECLRDCEDVDRAEVLVLLLTGDKQPGAMFELSRALCKGKLSVIIGQPHHIFHYHPDVVHFATEGEFIEWTNSFNTEEIICE